MGKPISGLYIKMIRVHHPVQHRKGTSDAGLTSIITIRAQSYRYMMNQDCGSTETMFRIIQSTPSPKVGPLKSWLARVGRERIDEIEDSELTMTRMQQLYEEKEYLIDKRMRGIAVRQDLTGVHQRAGSLQFSPMRSCRERLG
jgi:hypothetical protein